jgi:hypothetical protein
MLNTVTGFDARTVDTSRGGHSQLLNREWLKRPADERFLSLEALLQHTKKRTEPCRETNVQLSRLGVHAFDSGRLGFSVGDRVMETTHWSFGQVCREIGAPADFVRRLQPSLSVEVLRDQIGRQNHAVKVYEDGDRIRAVNSPTYGRIPDHKIVAAVKRMTEASDANFKVPGVMNWGTGKYDPRAPVSIETTTLFASDRDVAMFLCDDEEPIDVGKLPNGEPDLMFRGLFVKNSEVGDGSLYVATMYLRAVCANRCLWGIEGFQDIRIRHTRHAPRRLSQEVMPVLNSYQRRGDKSRVVKGVVAAKAEQVVTVPPWNDPEEAREQQLKFLTGKLSFSKQVAEAILKHEAPGTPQDQATSVWDMVNLVTSYAQTAKHHNRRLEIEGRASEALRKVTASV